MVKAAWMSGDKPQEQILLDVHPYGLRVYDRNREHLPGMEQVLILRAREKRLGGDMVCSSLKL